MQAMQPKNISKIHVLTAIKSPLLSSTRSTFHDGIGFKDLLLDPRVLATDCSEELQDKFGTLRLSSSRFTTAHHTTSSKLPLPPSPPSFNGIFPGVPGLAFFFHLFTKRTFGDKCCCLDSGTCECEKLEISFNYFILV